ncbi:MAG: Lipid biosynthesis lauroyltransferase [Fibrobacteres bacterium]|nr:Lipid biosynthesis lauroyltransferase [Fibrobacterota bacterium]
MYPALRPGHSGRLRDRFAASPFGAALNLRTYYAARMRLLLEGLAIHGASLPASRILVHGESHYRSALAANRPIALIGLHSGVLELLHRVPEAPEGRPFRILTAPAFSPPLTEFMARGRELEGKRILWIGNRDQRGLENGLRSVIASNGVLALMADQHPGPAGDCEYLGLWDRIRVPWPARLMRFLASRGFLCVPVSTRLEPDGRSRFDFHPVLKEPDGDGIRAFLETAITAAPDQWNWSYPKIRILTRDNRPVPGLK